MITRTSDAKSLDIIDNLRERPDPDGLDQIWVVQSKGSDTLNILKNGLIKSGDDYLTSSTTIKEIVTLSELAYNQPGFEPDANTLYIIVPAP